MLNAQQGSIARIEAQEIAGYINHAVSAGSGYATTLSLAQGPGSIPYNIYVSTSGVVIVNSTAGGQPVSAYAFSNGRNMSINGSLQYSGNGVGVYLIPSYTGVVRISNIGGTVYIDKSPVSSAGLLGSGILSNVQEGYSAVFNDAFPSFVAANSPSLNPVGSFTILAWMAPTKYPGSGNFETVVAKVGPGRQQRQLSACVEPLKYPDHSDRQQHRH